MFTTLSLYKSHILSSKKIILYSCLGLIIALSLISSSMFFIDNTRQQLIDKYIGGANFNGNDISIDIQTPFSTSKSGQDKIQNIATSIMNQNNFYFINKSDLKLTFGFGGFESYLSYNIQGGTGLPDQINIFYQNIPVYIFQLTPYLKNELQKISIRANGTSQNFPTNTTSNSLPNAYLFYDSINYYSNLILSPLRKGNFTFNDFDPSTGRVLSNYKVNVTDYMVFQPGFNNSYNSNYRQEGTVQFEYPYIYSISNMLKKPNVMIFVPDINRLANIIQSKANDTSFGNSFISNYYILHFGFLFSKLNLHDIQAFLYQQNNFVGTLTIELQNSGFQQIVVNLNTLTYLNTINQEINSLLVTTIVLVVPSLIVVIFFTHYAFSLIYKNIAQNIAIYKTRGSSNWVIFGFQIFDILIIMFISIIVALAFGVPVSMFSLKTDFLLSFNNSLPNNFVFDFQTIAENLFYIAIALEIIINTNRTRKFSTLTINETENPVERADPYWKRHNIDIYLVVIGFFVFSIYYLIVTDQKLSQIFLPIINLFILLIIFSPFAVIIGLIMLLSRLVPIIIESIGSYLWKRFGNITALSFKNIYRYKNTTIRAILISVSIIAFLTLFFAQPYSMYANYQQNAYYNSGAEAVALFPNNEINFNITKFLNQNFSPYLDSICTFVLLTGQTELNDQMQFLFVNTNTYLNSSYLNFNLGLKNNINNDFKDLTIQNFNNITPANILLNQQALQNRKANIGSTIDIVTTTPFTASQRFKIIDSFVNWPLLKANSIIGSQLGSFYAIGDINYFLHTLNGTIKDSIFNSIVEAGLLIKFKESVTNLTYVASQIEHFTPLTFKSIPSLDIKSFKQGFTFLTTVGEINVNVILSLTIILISFLFFVEFQLLERRREIFIERALGIKLHQLLFILYLENIILAIFSIVFGSILGVILTDIISLLTNNPFQSYPPVILLIPFNLLFSTDLIIFFVTIIISLIPVARLLKQGIADDFA